mgnify:CR=1 FL=1
MQVGELHDPHALKSRRQVLDRNRHLLDAGNPESLPKTEGRNADGRGRHADRHAPVLLHEAMHALSRTAGQNGQKDDDLAKQREACKHGEREDAAVAGGQHPGGSSGLTSPPKNVAVTAGKAAMRSVTTKPATFTTRGAFIGSQKRQSTQSAQTA